MIIGKPIKEVTEEYYEAVVRPGHKWRLKDWDTFISVRHEIRKEGPFQLFHIRKESQLVDIDGGAE